MKIVELIRRPDIAQARSEQRIPEGRSMSGPPAPQEAFPISIQWCIDPVARLKTPDPRLRAAIDEALLALSRAKEIAEEVYGA